MSDQLNTSSLLLAPYRVLATSSETPLPAAAASASLFSMLPKAMKNNVYRPAQKSLIGFGTAFAIGGFIIYDGDLTNGAGFTSAWSILYLMVNGKPTLKQLRPGPVLVSGLIAINAVNYGRKFFFPTRVGKSIENNP